MQGQDSNGADNQQHNTRRLGHHRYIELICRKGAKFDNLFAKQKCVCSRSKWARETAGTNRQPLTIHHWQKVQSDVPTLL